MEIKYLSTLQHYFSTSHLTNLKQIRRKKIFRSDFQKPDKAYSRSKLRFTKRVSDAILRAAVILTPSLTKGWGIALHVPDRAEFKYGSYWNESLLDTWLNTEAVNRHHQIDWLTCNYSTQEKDNTRKSTNPRSEYSST